MSSPFLLNYIYLGTQNFSHVPMLFSCIRLLNQCEFENICPNMSIKIEEKHKGKVHKPFQLNFHVDNVHVHLHYINDIINYTQA